jgi:excinuclease ABC subunit A
VSEPSHITVRGAREHNLRDVDLDVPRNALVVFTGVSGSGKSSLAFDTIHKEGQRRFMESLSAYARQFLGQMERPKVETIDGLSPTVCIDQKTVNRNPRSTVGTVTEIYDHLRLLMSRLGRPHCPECGTAIAQITVDAIADDVIAQGAGKKVQILGPVVRERKGEYRKEQEDLARDGWVRARIDGEVRDLGEPIALARYEKHTIEVIVDRLVPSEADRTRLSEALESAIRLGNGVVGVLIEDQELTFATQRACPKHPEISIPELEPRLFSFNAPQGACDACGGMGVQAAFSVDLIVDFEKPASECYRAFNAEGRVPFSHFDKAALTAIIKKLSGNPKAPLKGWAADTRERLIRGDKSVTYTLEIDREGRKETRVRPWPGLLGMVEQIWRWTSYSGFEALRTENPCPKCLGKRLNPIARSVTFRDRAIDAFTNLSVSDAFAFFTALKLAPDEQQIGEPLVAEIRDRLTFLHEVGLDYLTLDRSAATLSGGEAQRIRLAAQVGSALQGVTYVLDEPSIGLHPRDNRRLLQALFRLRDRGNSVIVVEHDAETIDAADYVFDIGPGAGREGGHVVAQGPPAKFRKGAGVTAAWMRGELSIPIPAKRRKGKGKLVVKGAASHNVTGVDAAFPLGTLIAVTGVSGSGKSSLIFDVLERSMRGLLDGDRIVGCESLDGIEAIDKVVTIEQTPIGRTPRSNPATYTGIFDLVRDLFAATPESKARGYKKGRFSFNVAGGRCEECEGAGVKTVAMQFLPDVEVPCDACGTRRFNGETLEITWRNHTIHDVLEMTIAEALEEFGAVPKLRRMLETLVSVGLGYVPLGQPATTLSGGEAQRLKIATELQRPPTGRTVYLLDEPTTGLHFEDVRRLLDALDRLVQAGNTVIVVEHHVDVIKCADFVLDMGPEGGTGGGKVVGIGTPEVIATLDTPTGRALAMVAGLTAHPVAAESPAPRRKTKAKAGGRAIVVEGARKHNLQGIDVRIPHNTMTVITGPSGSGKTSLALDTVFSEGQRRYVESLSTYARRFLGRMERAPVDRLEGLAPAIAIDQHASSHNPRSTVATVTEIHDVLRLLYARVGEPHCPVCDALVEGFSPVAGAQRLRELAPGPGWLITALPPAMSPEERRRTLVAEGWTRVLDGRSGVELPLDDAATADALEAGCLLVIDRFDPAKTAATRISEGIATAHGRGDGEAWFRGRDGTSIALPLRPSCPTHGEVLPAELTPRHFSFNSRLGSCPGCDGLGQVRGLVPDRLFTRKNLPFWDALDPRVRSVLERSARTALLVGEVLAHVGSTDVPVDRWSKDQLFALTDGVPTPLTVSWSQQWGRTKRTISEERLWTGLRSLVHGWNAHLGWLIDEVECPLCHGGRLRPELLSIRLGGRGIDAFSRLPVADALAAAQTLGLHGEKAAIAERPVEELVRRLRFLDDVGLGYLPLDRAAGTLSGGESQRIRLASQLGTGLTGCVYVLDEPTIGLHPRDTDRLIGTLLGLRDLGNTVLVVEHDPETIARADRVIDLGPGAGRYGGTVLAAGTPAEITANPDSPTGRYMSGKDRIPRPKKRRKPRAELVIRQPTGNNLRCGDVAIPLGVWVAVSGVSGSGKSTLILDTLAPALRRHLGEDPPTPAPHAGLEVGEAVDRVVVVDQQPIGRTPRSTPATYVGVMDPIRALFAQTPGARERGFEAGRFSFNAQGGRCEACEGRGAVLVEMHFLPDVWVTCTSCLGKRYNRETLDVRFKGRNIAEVLAMRADEAVELFAAHRAIKRQLQALVDVGLGYIALGQPGTTLSGGEAQRVKLAAELGSRKGHAVYILDEPTTGLHLSDVAKLVQVLHRLVDDGHTVITIEHHLDVLAQADWMLDLGPEGGVAGGLILAAGPPSAIEAADTPTGQALKRHSGMLRT